MNAFLNYLVESNVGLCAFMLVYVLLLKKETDFVKKRLFLLLSIGVSLVFPLMHFETLKVLFRRLRISYPQTGYRKLWSMQTVIPNH